MRISGENRYETASVIAKNLDDSNYAVIVSSNSFPDALVSSNLAKHLNAPILLADTSLPAETINSLEEKGVKNVVILGGVNSVSQNAEGKLRELSYSVRRISGEDRYDTAILANEYTLNKDIVYLASGESFADSLSASALAARKSSPLLLTESNTLTSRSLSAIKAWSSKKIVLVGGVNSISSEIEEKLKSLGLEVTRISGEDRYETSVKISNTTSSNGLILASGEGYIDALTASNLAQSLNYSLVLTAKDSLNPYLRDSLKNYDKENIHVVGGSETISDNVIKEVSEILSEASN